MRPLTRLPRERICLYVAAREAGCDGAPNVSHISTRIRMATHLSACADLATDPDNVLVTVTLPPDLLDLRPKFERASMGVGRT
jgi:hypothetical protein